MVPMIAFPKKKGEAAAAKEAEPEKAAQRRERKREEDANLRRHVTGVSVAAMILSILAGIVAAVALSGRPAAAGIAMLAGIILGVFLLFALKVARQWERAVVLRLGKFVGLRGRGLFVVRPSGLPARIERVDIATGHRTLWKELMPTDRAGLVAWLNLHFSRDNG